MIKSLIQASLRVGVPAAPIARANGWAKP